MDLDPSQDLYDRWRAFVTRAFKRRGMYTATSSFVEMTALLVGFDNGVGQPMVLGDFQRWMTERHQEGRGPAFFELVLHEAFNDHEAAVRRRTLSDEENRVAVDKLAELFLAFLDSREGTTQSTSAE